MKAFVYKGERHIDVADVSKPEAGDGEVLLKPLYVGVCFSEYHAYVDRNCATFVRPGLILGHEGSAEIAALGRNLKGDWKVGQRVAVHPLPGCGKCIHCHAGHPMACSNPTWVPQMCCEYFSAPESACFTVPAEVSDLAAANVEGIGTGAHVIRHSGMTVGDNCVILGAEDYALAALQWAKMGGARRIIVSDPYKVRREVARKLGADIVLDPAVDKNGAWKESSPIYSENMQQHKMTPANAAHPYPAIQKEMPFGPDFVFVAIETYVPESLDYLAEAINMVRVGGTVVIVRAFYGDGGTPNYDSAKSWVKDVSIRNFGLCYTDEPSRGGRERGDYRLTIEEIARKRIDGETQVTRIVPFEEIRTKDDLDSVYGLYPERCAKVFFRIWGR